MHLAPPPNSRDLLPPILACLPTSFAAPRPPPALLPLLSPLLRQRVNYLSGDSAGGDGWLSLLSWDSQRAKKLPSVVERMDFEPHPVSGELELEETNPARYRRLDQETLQARIEVEQFGLLPIFIWCEKNERGGEEEGWKLFELRTLDDLEDGTRWFDSPSEANEAGSSGSVAVAPVHEVEQEAAEEDDANDDYWASYDKTSAAHTPAPPQTAAQQTQGTSDTDYYARYGQEVQPAMDPHDPDEDMGDQAGSSLRGDSLLRPNEPQAPSSNGIANQADYLSSLQPHAGWKEPHDSAVHTGRERSLDGEHDISMPRPISPSNSHSSIDKLEERAAEMSSTGDTAQLAIKQHISTDVKSLFRLAKASGMSRHEFTRIVKTELDVLSLLEQDE